MIFDNKPWIDKEFSGLISMWHDNIFSMPFSSYFLPGLALNEVNIYNTFEKDGRLIQN